MPRRKTRKTRRRRKQRGGSQPIILMEIRWGLGNQIIEYCVACAIKKKFGYEMFILPPSENVHAANRDYRALFTRGKPVEKIPDGFMNTGPYLVNKNDEPLNISEIPQGKNIYVDKVGFFFNVYKDVLPEIAKEMHLTLNKLYPDLQFKDDATRGFIHVRRGDFIKNGISKDYSFYNSAITLGNSKSAVTKWLMFSDDLPWCQSQSWNNLDKIEFVDEPDELKTLAMMSNCLGGAILCQSSFGWAGAVTGAYMNKGVVIAHSDHIQHNGANYSGAPDWIYLDNEGNQQEYKYL
jgi:hypothetical protein